MLERYFVKPDTLDRLLGSWIAELLERYVSWLAEQGYAARTVFRRVPIVWRFGEFARNRGASSWADLAEHVNPFGPFWLAEHGHDYPTPKRRVRAEDSIRNPVQQMLRLVLPDYRGNGRRCRVALPFLAQAPGFFNYLREERGLRETSLLHYGHYLRALESYLQSIGLLDLRALSPPVISAFITQSPCAYASKSKSAMHGLCGTLRVFLRYLYREGMVDRDLSLTVEGPRVYRLSDVPRSISWDEVRRMLEVVDRRSAVGKRDYAILLLLVTYGLRAREITALTLDDIDWKRERLQVPERKAGHSTAYPLSPVVGEAILDDLRNGRPKSTDRHVFFRVVAPPTPLTWNAISARVGQHLRKANISVPRPGSHTLRHTCVQRLVDAEFSLKVIGDYVGHRSPDSTEVYAKVAVEALREVALGPGEEIV